jgi:acetolactate synthase small subunit
VVDASRGIDEVLAAHLGAGSPLLTLLAPGEGNQLVASIRASIDNTLKAQSDAVLAQFSLDNENGALRRLLGELTARHGDLQKALAEQVEAVVDEFSLDNEEGALSRLVDQVRKAQQQISSEFSLDNEGSGLSRLARLVNEHYETQRRQAQGFQDRVLQILERIDARRAEQARSTTHGHMFEEAVGEAIRRLVQPAGDVFEVVSNTAGNIARSKKGDFVVTLSDDSAAPGARIVVEAKEDASYRLNNTLDEAEAARSNRVAGICLFVHSKKTAPAELEPLARYGQTLVVVWDADDELTDIVLFAALTCAKALSVRAGRRSTAEAASMQKIDAAIATITKQIEGFDEIRTHATTVSNAVEKIDRRARIMAEQITRQSETLVEQLGALRIDG